MGHTRQVAESIAAGLLGAAGAASPRSPRSPFQVQCVQVGWLSTDLPDVDLLVLGAPTHFLGLPAPQTRQLWVRGVVEASRRGSPEGHRLLEPGSAGPGLREFLAELPDAVGDGSLSAVPSPRGRLRQPLAAAFDTRLARPLAGGASRSIARGLRRHGYELALPPKGFLVSEMSGPLCEGELERAERWGARLAAQLVATPLTPR
jgi:hypothetical protein